MDEKMTPADLIRKGIDAVADAENKGISVEKDADAKLALETEDEAIEFASFSIDDNRDTTPGSKAGTRLPTVSMPNAKVMGEPEEGPVTQATIKVDLPEDIKVSPAKNVHRVYESEEAEPVDVDRRAIGMHHSRTWLRNHELAEAQAAQEAEAKAEESRQKTQEELLAEIYADTPEERRRKEAAQEEGRKLAEDIFSNSAYQQPPEDLADITEPGKVVDTTELDEMAALDHFLEESKRERRERMNMPPSGTGEVKTGEDVPISAKPQHYPTSGGYFGVGRKSGFKAEAAANAAGGKVIESRSLAVDPTTLSKRELREYNRINRRGDKEITRQQKKSKRRLKVWQRVLIALLALILLAVAVAGIFFGRYYGLLGDLDIGDNPFTKVSVENQSEANIKTMNILLVGLDSRKDNYTGRSDSMILVTVNKQSKKLIMTSFLRDSYVNIPGHGKHKLNAAYALGGSNLLINTIYENFGIVVDRVAVFNFLLVIDVIDYLGGITVDITDEELPYLNMYIHDQNEELYNSATPNKGQINSGPGTYNLTGNQALAYARIRYVGTDVQRSERQRLVLSECLEKVKNLSTSQLSQMATQFLPRIKTDLGSSDVASLIVTLLRAGSYEQGGMAIPTDGTWKDAKVGEEEVIKITDFEANTAAWEKLVS